MKFTLAMTKDLMLVTAESPQPLSIEKERKGNMAILQLCFVSFLGAVNNSGGPSLWQSTHTQRICMGCSPLSFRLISPSMSILTCREPVNAFTGCSQAELALTWKML